MEEFGPIALFVLWAIASLFGKAAQGRKSPRQRVPRPETQHRDAPATRTGQPTTFEELLAEMRGQLEQAKEMERAEAHTPEPWQQQQLPEEVIEDTTTLEEDVEVVSMEIEPVRHERSIETMQREDAEALVQRRIQAAELRNREWRLEDHRRFDQLIRAPKEPVRRRISPAHRSLRQAMIWNEVLQPPVSLREQPGSGKPT